MTKRLSRYVPAETRLWAQVRKTETCWLWTGKVRPDGYGVFRREARETRVHRYAFELAFGAIPDGLDIDHKCRVRHCVNPSHLQAVTRSRNLENRVASRSSKTGIRGVSWDTRARKWVVQVRSRGRAFCGGYFADIAEAETAAIALRNRVMTNNLPDRIKETS